jgi:hypothetical protein
MGITAFQRSKAYMIGVKRTKRTPRPCSGPSARRGFTLVEALIVLMTFGILVSLLSDIFVRTSSFGRQIIQRAKLQADARNSLEALARAVRVSDLDYASWGGTLPTGGTGPSFGCGFGEDIDGTHCRGYITATSETSWQVPSDWNPLDNSIEVIGAGGKGANAVSAASPGAGGGGGEYRKAINISLTPDSTVAINIPSGGAGSSVDGAWVKNNIGTKVVEAKNGGNASGITAGAGGTGGSGGSGNFNGGSGGNTTDAGNTSGAGGGGGGSAGPSGAGMNGGTAQGTTGRGGGGGGGSNGGQSTAGGNSTGSTGGNGGNGYDGTGGGTGASSGIGGNATAGVGAGGGGAGNTSSSTAATGGSGSSQSLWDSNIGPSGGGGGAGAASGSSATGNRNGGTGGTYGGGGGGAGYSGSGSVGTGGAGGQGLIVIIYAPEVASAEPNSELRLINPVTGLASRVALRSTDSECYSDSKSFPCIAVSTDDGSTWTPLSPKGAKIEALNFYASPSTDPFLYNGETGTFASDSQPIVTTVMTIRGLAGRTQDEWKFTLQTTMTPRLYLR